MGAWSNDIYERLGYRMPLAAKRGYHLHYAAEGNAVLNHPVLDVDAGGGWLAPMNKGIRLTTGIEFAPRDAPKSPIQIARLPSHSRGRYSRSARRTSRKPWMGLRPCFPDMRPVIGPAPRHDGIWFAFGHNHHGFSLGPVTGRILAEMMTGENPVVETGWFRADRFLRTPLAPPCAGRASAVAPKALPRRAPRMVLLQAVFSLPALIPCSPSSASF